MQRGSFPSGVHPRPRAEGGKGKMFNNYTPSTSNKFFIRLVAAIFILCLTFTPALGFASATISGTGNLRCGKCDPARCPKLTYCEAKMVKDQCNCCTVCSSPKYQPHALTLGVDALMADSTGSSMPQSSRMESARSWFNPPSEQSENKCEKVECPKFQMCRANVQGIPLCMCPGAHLCRSTRQRTVCGTDGHTYKSKCYMRIAACNQGMMIRKKHKGACTPDDVRDGEAYIKKMRRRMRRKEKRKHRKQLLEKKAAKRKTSRGKESVKENALESQGGHQDAELIHGGGADLSSMFGESIDVRGLAHRSNGKFGDQETEDERKRAERKRKRRRRKKRRQRKRMNKQKRDKKERRKRRRKRQNGSRSRSKRHRMLKSRRFLRYDRSPRWLA